MNQQVLTRLPHTRVIWGPNDPSTIFACEDYTIIKGTHPSVKMQKYAQRLYQSAKFSNSHSDAARIVEEYCDERVIDRVIENLEKYIIAGRRIIVVHPKPNFVGDEATPDVRPITNAIPFAFAAYIADQLDGELCDDIIQCNRPGRRTSTLTERFLYQPKFEGHVDPNAVYVLVDDNCTLGGTLAMLRSHIVGMGGTVGAACVLCSRNGEDLTFPIARTTLNVLLSSYGPDINTYWMKEVGHEISALTDVEGRALCGRFCDGRGIASFQQLRESFDKTRAGIQ